jgi:coenzyme F420-dependent glucose-6-phosphate dehydrogenase
MSMELGYHLASEEHEPNALVAHARRAEEAGFAYGIVSDHFHPWIDAQGQSPFVWAVLGGIARETRRLRVGTGVTCPLIRIHPALVAQAAATVAAMLEGRFFLGLGTGERLNEHILGGRWPPTPERQAMLEEAVGLIRLLWTGSQQTFEGRFYTVEQARLYTLPAQAPPVYIAAAGPGSARLAGRIGDGLISTAPARRLVQEFVESGGASKPRYGELPVCWAESEERALETTMRQWPLAGLPGVLNAELALPSQYDQVVRSVTPEAVKQRVVLGPDPEAHVTAIGAYVRAGFDHVHVHQIGGDQEGFFRFYERAVLPHLERVAAG